jgi:hypothetical protein
MIATILITNIQPFLLKSYLLNFFTVCESIIHFIIFDGNAN